MSHEQKQTSFYIFIMMLDNSHPEASVSRARMIRTHGIRTDQDGSGRTASGRIRTRKSEDLVIRNENAQDQNARDPGHPRRFLGAPPPPPPVCRSAAAGIRHPGVG